MSNTVIILTHHPDPHAEVVREEVARRGVPLCCLDQADFPPRVTLCGELFTNGDGWSGTLAFQDQLVAFDDIISIWRRRPQPWQAPASYSSGLKTFAEREAAQAFLGLLESLEDKLPGALLVSRPDALRRAERKALQLHTAHRLGLCVPRTLLTNDPAAVRAFYEECQGGVIVKPVAKGIIDDEPQHCFYTSRVTAEHLRDLERVRLSAHLFQEEISKALEIRIVVIGQHVFAAEIYSQQS